MFRTQTSVLIVALAIVTSGLVAQTVVAMDLQAKVQRLTTQTFDCDGVRVTLKTDRTDATTYARDKCEVYEFTSRPVR